MANLISSVLGSGTAGEAAAGAGSLAEYGEAAGALGSLAGGAAGSGGVSQAANGGYFSKLLPTTGGQAATQNQTFMKDLVSLGNINSQGGGAGTAYKDILHMGGGNVADDVVDRLNTFQVGGQQRNKSQDPLDTTRQTTEDWMRLMSFLG